MENFGINLKQIIFQLINFFIVFFILKKFLYKPILDFIKKQKEQEDAYTKIAHEMDNQKELLRKLSEDQKNELKKLYSEKLESAEKEAKKIIEETKEVAKKEGARLKEEYLKEASQTKETILKSAKDDIYHQALAITEKLLRSNLTETQKKNLMDLALENLKNDENS